VIPYVSTRDGRFEHASDAIDAIERENCEYGCVLGARSAANAEALGGWGGTCWVLAEVAVGGGQVVRAIEDHGDKLVCRRRVPLWTI
jgi:hypothetical protein